MEYVAFVVFCGFDANAYDLCELLPSCDIAPGNQSIQKLLHSKIFSKYRGTKTFNMLCAIYGCG